LLFLLSHPSPVGLQALRPSNMPRFRLGCCDRRHRLGFE
jgi:hypothetical protein